ncbi:MAG: J domain-containing protein [Pseudomonadota bacterium]
MGPIDRVRARALAYELLGVNHGSDPEEIRAAWRRVAFEMHPDRHGGDQTGFIQAKAAYDFLCKDEAYAFSTPAGARDAMKYQRQCATMGRKRPAVAPRVTPLRPDILYACRGLLAERRCGRKHPFAAHLRLQADAPTDPAEGGADHVPGAIEREGRLLTYLVASVLSPGVNCVALPTAVLECTRRQKPQLLAISTQDRKSGDLRIPDATRARLFPNARDVRIRFGAALGVEAAAEPSPA